MNDNNKTKLKRHFLTFDDLNQEDMHSLLSLCREMVTNETYFRGRLRGRAVGLMFNKPSTRTRTSFWKASIDLGADVIFIDETQTQLKTGENYIDTGKTLGLFLDALVIRSNGLLEDMRALGQGCSAVINAMSACEHPTQALADYSAIYQHFGFVDGISIAYFGEGNNTVAALVKLFSTIPACSMHLFMPRRYSLTNEFISQYKTLFAKNSGHFSVSNEIPKHLPKVDIVYCTRWRTMGVGHNDSNWLEDFSPFAMTPELFNKVAAPRGIFMHDLPAVREEDVSSEVIDGSKSIVWKQAYCKKSAASASLLWSLGEGV